MFLLFIGQNGSVNAKALIPCGMHIYMFSSLSQTIILDWKYKCIKHKEYKE